jgi:hypothetical protein
VRFTIDVAVAFLVAVVTAVVSAWFAVDHAPLLNPMRVGAWTAWPRAGGVDADPYDLAAAARSPVFPLGSAEGLAFTADSDDAGGALDGSCRYEISGDVPPTRLWTLTAYDAAGRLLPNAAERHGYHSSEILRRLDGTFVISVAPRVQPGNWLPVANGNPFRLVLRLFDTPLTSPGRPTPVAMPAVRKVGCP